MDKVNRKILSILRESGRKPYTEIASELDVSEGTVRNRVEQMQEKGVIKNFTVKTAEKRSAIVAANLTTGVDIQKVVEKMPNQIVVNEVAGEHDLIVEFTRQDLEKLNNTIDEIRSIKDVEDTTTFSVLKTHNI